MASRKSRWVNFVGLTLVLAIVFTAVALMPPKKLQALRGSATPSPQPKRSISFESLPPKDIVKIVGWRNHEADDWYDKLEFEIKNASTSDIWYIEFNVVLPELRREDTTPEFTVEFGDNSPVSGGVNKPNKPLLRPGDNFVFRIPHFQVQNLITKYSIDRVHVPEISDLRLELYKIYLTDGRTFVRGKRVTITPDRKIRQWSPSGQASIAVPTPRSEILTATAFTGVGLFLQTPALRRPLAHSGARVQLGTQGAETI